MKALLLVFILFSGFHASSQYYYKDIAGTTESSQLVKNYSRNKVTRVAINSYDADNVKSDNFSIVQEFSAPSQYLKTVTHANGVESTLFSYFDENGNVIRTLDSSNIVVSTTHYEFNAKGQLAMVTHTSSDSSHLLNKSEVHIWQWGDKHPERMLRIKNSKDTTVVEFGLDEDGNVGEETEITKGVRSTPVYYYYDDNNRLTDIVKFNTKMGLLLPINIFSYTESGLLRQKIEVPVNNPDYLIWTYQYNQQGLKVREKIYSKNDKKNAVGTIEYQYSFGS